MPLLSMGRKPSASTDPIAAFEAKGTCQRLELTLVRLPLGGGGSFGIGLAHYDKLCNIVTTVRDADTCPVRIGDIIIAVQGIRLVTEGIETHLPSRDVMNVTVVRPGPGALTKLLEDMAPRVKQKAPQLTAGQLISTGSPSPWRAHNDAAAAGASEPSAVASLQFDSEGLSSPRSPEFRRASSSSDASEGDSPSPGQPIRRAKTLNQGAVLRARSMNMASSRARSSSSGLDLAAADDSVTPTSVLDRPSATKEGEGPPPKEQGGHEYNI